MDWLALVFVIGIIVLWIAVEIIRCVGDDGRCDGCDAPYAWPEKATGLCWFGIIVCAVSALLAVVD